MNSDPNPTDPINSEKATEKATKPAAAKKRKSSAKAKTPKVAKTPKAATETKPTKPRVPNPSNVRLNKSGVAALAILEAQNPEKSRGQVFNDTLASAVGKIGSAPTLNFKRLSSDDLLAQAGLIADAEKVLKKFRRDTIRARLDKTVKARLVADADDQLQSYRAMRLTICRMIGIPVHHDLSNDINLSIGALMEKKEACDLKFVQDAYDTGILVLSIFRIDDDLKL